MRAPEGGTNALPVDAGLFQNVKKAAIRLP